MVILLRKCYPTSHLIVLTRIGSSTFLSSMGYASRYWRSGSSTSSAQIRVVEEIVEQNHREASRGVRCKT